MPIDDAVSTITTAYRARSLPISADSELHHLLNEVLRFEDSARDLTPGQTDADTDEQAVLVGAELLRAVRLADAIALLVHHTVPKITETLKTLSSFKHGNVEQEAQFDESEYELHVASQFVGFGQRVSFVEAKSPSRYQQRVEFMLGYKWPVECKRPRSSRQILPNIEKAIAKIDERAQPGLICVGLEAALPIARETFLEVDDTNDICSQISKHTGPWLQANREAIQTKLLSSWTRFLIVTYMVRCYMHKSEDVALPSLRLGLSASGDWITNDVPKSCIEALKTERGGR